MVTAEPVAGGNRDSEHVWRCTAHQQRHCARYVPATGVASARKHDSSLRHEHAGPTPPAHTTVARLAPPARGFPGPTCEDHLLPWMCDGTLPSDTLFLVAEEDFRIYEADCVDVDAAATGQPPRGPPRSRVGPDWLAAGKGGGKGRRRPGAQPQDEVGNLVAGTPFSGRDRTSPTSLRSSAVAAPDGSHATCSP